MTIKAGSKNQAIEAAYAKAVSLATIAHKFFELDVKVERGTGEKEFDFPQKANGGYSIHPVKLLNAEGHCTAQINVEGLTVDGHSVAWRKINTNIFQDLVVTILQDAINNGVDQLEYITQIAKGNGSSAGMASSEFKDMYLNPLTSLYKTAEKYGLNFKPTVRLAERGDVAPLGTVFAGAEIQYKGFVVTPEVAAQFTKQHQHMGIKAEARPEGLTVIAENPRGLEKLNEMSRPSLMKPKIETIEQALLERP